MKKLSLLLTLLLGTVAFCKAQKQYEVGPRITDWSGFGLILKKEINAKRYLRMRTGSFALSGVDRQGASRLGGSVSLGIGLEKRVNIDESLQFFHGFEPRVSIALSLPQENRFFTGSLGMGYVLGLNYLFNDRWSVSLELVPGIDAYFISRRGDFSLNLRGNGDMNQIGIALHHRFQFSK